MNLFPIHGASMTSGATAAAPRVEVAAHSGPRNKISRQPGHARTVPPWVFRAGVHRIESRATRARCSATLELDRYGQSCGVSAENARLAARFFLASETTLARAACPFQWRPRTRRRCLTPHATMNPAAYPDGRWSTGSHTTSGASPVTQRCDCPSVAPSSSLLHRRPRGSTVSMPARFFVGNGNAPREEVDPPSHVDLTAPPIPPTSQENIRRQAQRVRRHTHGAQPRSTPRHQSRSPSVPGSPKLFSSNPNHSSDPSSIIPRADAGADAHVRARHRVVLARPLRRGLSR